MTLAFMDNYEKIMEGDLDCSLLNYMRDKDTYFDSMLEKIKNLTEKVFNSRRKIELEIGVYATIEIILDAFIPAINDHIENHDIKKCHSNQKEF